MSLGLLISHFRILWLFVFECWDEADHAGNLSVFFLVLQLGLKHVFSFVENTDFSPWSFILHFRLYSVAVFCLDLFGAFGTGQIRDFALANDLNRVLERVVNVKILVGTKPLVLLVHRQERHWQGEVVRTSVYFQ